MLSRCLCNRHASTLQCQAWCLTSFRRCSLRRKWRALCDRRRGCRIRLGLRRKDGVAHFWDAAVIGSSVSKLAEGLRFPICQPPALIALFSEAGLRVQTQTIDVPTTFRDFDDYWNPFLGGRDPRPAQCRLAKNTAAPCGIEFARRFQSPATARFR